MKESFNADSTAVAAYRRRLNSSALIGLGLFLVYGLQSLLATMDKPHQSSNSWWILLAICLGVAYTGAVVRSIVSANAKTIEFIEFADSEIRIFTMDTRLFGGLYKMDGTGGILHKGSVYIRQHSLDNSYNDKDIL